MKKKLVAVVGKSGTGKDSLIKELLELDPSYFKKLVPITTRPKRDGEVEGDYYFYREKEDIIAKLVNDEMLDTTEFRGWFYGVEKNQLDETKVNIGAFNNESIEQIYDILYSDIDLFVLFLNVEDKIRLIRILSREIKPDIQEIIRRYGTDEEDFNSLKLFLDNNDICTYYMDNDAPLSIPALAKKSLKKIKENFDK